MRNFYLFIVVFLLYKSTYAQTKYVGNNLLDILGVNRDTSLVYKEFTNDWGIGKRIALPDKGFKISKNPQTNEVTALLFANKGYEIGNMKFQKYLLEIPFGISIDDSYESIRTKLGSPKKEDELVSKFTKDGVNIILGFKNSAKSKIDFIKISIGFGATLSNPNTTDDSKTQKNEKETTAIKIKPSSTLPEIKETTPVSFAKSGAKSFESKVNANNINNTLKSTFYKTIMMVMESGVESYFSSIQSGNEILVPNFWNYKHTYKTYISIPGTIYNFIYSFPFANSQKDWVAVIKEGQFDKDFRKEYEEILAKIKSDFPQSEGWKYSNPSDGSINAPLKDFEVQNNKFGSVILDYQQNPLGKSVLYLRMLLYYD